MNQVRPSHQPACAESAVAGKRCNLTSAGLPRNSGTRTARTWTEITAATSLPPPEQSNPAAAQECICLVGDVDLPDEGPHAHAHARARAPRAVLHNMLADSRVAILLHVCAVTHVRIMYSYSAQMLIQTTCTHRGYGGSRRNSSPGYYPAAVYSTDTNGREAQLRAPFEKPPARPRIPCRCSHEAEATSGAGAAAGRACSIEPERAQCRAPRGAALP